MGKKKAMKTKTNKWYLQPGMMIPGIFVMSVVIRFMLACAISAGPTVYIDEGLYINIARSLATQGEVMYRAQPVSYVYLLYPISMLAAFVLPASVNLYRVLQLWNAVMISTMVFPVYLLCKQLKFKKEHAYTVSAASMLLPEIALSTYLVAESLIYPLMMWIFFLAYLTIDKNEKWYLPLLFGILNGVSYFAKPGCVVFGSCFLLVVFVYSLKKHDKKRAGQMFCSLLLTGAVIALGYAVYGLLFEKASVLNLYEKQIPTIDVENILIMAQGVLFHVFAFAISAGSALVLIPCVGFKKQNEKEQVFFAAFLLGLIAMAVSVAIMIVPYEYDGTWGKAAVHLRYLMYFLPVLLVWMYLPELEGLRLKKKGLAALIVLSVIFVFPSGFNFFTASAGTYNSPALNAFYAHRAGKTLGILCICAVTAANLYLIGRLRKGAYNPSVRKTAFIVICAFMLVNGAMAYKNHRAIDAELDKDANHVAQALVEDDFVVVTNNRYDDFRGYQLDAHLHNPAQMVVMNNMLLDAVETGGVYRSFTPVVQAPNVANLPTIETDTLLFDVTTADYVEFADTVKTMKSPNGLYTIAQIEAGKPYLKTAIASMNAYTLSAADTGSLLVFDEEMLARGEVTLHISMRSPSGAARVTFASEGQSVTVDVNEQSQQYSVTLPMTTNAFFHFTISGTEDIVINQYYTE